MLTIDIHTHIIPQQLPKFAKQFGYGGFIELVHHKPQCAHMVFDDGKHFRTIEHDCWDPAVRIHDLDQDNVHMQVLSTIPVMFCYWAKGEHGLAISQFLNDHIAQVVADHPTRFMGLGTIPLQAPELAIKELERCVKELGFPGVQIGSHVGEWDLDEERLFPVFEAASELGACVFVHPWDMIGKNEMLRYWLPWLVGMPAETSRAICSMIFGGIFDKLPNLRVAFAHGGGSFPATVGRIARGFETRPDLCAVNTSTDPRQYLGKFYLDSLVHDEHALELMLQLVGPERIALGSDYPFPLGERPVGQLIRRMGLSEIEEQRLLGGTALEWLNIAVEDLPR